MTMPETTQSDLVEQLEAWSDSDAEYGHHERSKALAQAATEITRLRADSERLQKIESQIDGGRFDEWPTETFVGQLRMQARDNLDPEYSQFMAATANRMESLRAHCEAMEKALGLYTCHPCPVCSGDCGSANPPVLNCPTQAALNAFGGWDAYRKESGA